MTDYMRSIWAQDYKTFDLVIFGNGDTVGMRTNAIKYAIDNEYTYMVWTDTDDFFSRNRVGTSVIWLQTGYDFVFNEIDLVDEGGKPVEVSVLTRIGVKDEYDNADEILDRNIFGLSTTAVRVDVLRGLRVPKDIIAMDWFLYTCLLRNGYKGKFINAKTYYRQTDDSLVGMGRELTDKRLYRGIGVKSVHYKNVGLHDKAREMSGLLKEVQDDAFREHYIGVVNDNMDEIYKGWWSEILPIPAWEQYA